MPLVKRVVGFVWNAIVNSDFIQGIKDSIIEFFDGLMDFLTDLLFGPKPNHG